MFLSTLCKEGVMVTENTNLALPIPLLHTETHTLTQVHAPGGPARWAAARCCG